jgi:hypothetical protein
MSWSLKPTAAPVATAPVGHAPVSCGTRSLSLGKSSILDRLDPTSAVEAGISYFFQLHYNSSICEGRKITSLMKFLKKGVGRKK